MKNGSQESELTKALDQKGAEGWELVQVNAPFYYFKRPKVVKKQSGVETFKNL